MLIKQKSTIIETFKTLYDGFLVDIVTRDDEYEVWLYHQNYGVKSLMFGVSNLNTSYNDFLSMVIYNVEDYVLFYCNEYAD